LQRLTFIAFNEARAVWGANWCGAGVFHLPRNQDGFDKNIMSERLLTQGFNSEMAKPLNTIEAKEKVGIAAGGTFFPEGGWVNLQQACEDVFEDLLPEQKIWATEVKSIQQSKDGWQIYDSDSQLIATSKRLFLAGGLGVKNLAKTAGIELPLKPVRGQLSKFRFGKDSTWDKSKPKVALSGKAYCLPPQMLEDDQYEWVVGSSYDEEVEDLSVWPDSHDENRALIKEMLNHELVDSELQAVGAFVGIRCVASDRLPIMGPVLNHPGLYILTSLGSRGVMWSALASQMFTEHLAEELNQSAFFDARFFAGARLTAAGLTADLAGALLAARFFAGASNSKPIFPSA
jgi:tRNA 5-methylaminomethyl-2-thiouridine biosynthesis bifunctional protein